MLERGLHLKTFKNIIPKILNSIINYNQTAATQAIHVIQFI